MTRVMITLVLALAASAAIVGCRASGEVDPDGHVSSYVPAVP